MCLYFKGEKAWGGQQGIMPGDCNKDWYLDVEGWLGWLENLYSIFVHPLARMRAGMYYRLLTCPSTFLVSLGQDAALWSCDPHF